MTRWQPPELTYRETGAQRGGGANDGFRDHNDLNCDDRLAGILRNAVHRVADVFRQEKR